MITRRDIGERRGVEGGVDQSFLQEAREKNAWHNNNYLGRRTLPFFAGGEEVGVDTLRLWNRKQKCRIKRLKNRMKKKFMPFIMPANMHAANFAPEKGCFSNQLEVKNWKQRKHVELPKLSRPSFLVKLTKRIFDVFQYPTRISFGTPWQS